MAPSCGEKMALNSTNIYTIKITSITHAFYIAISAIMKTNKTPSSIQLCGDIGVLATIHTPSPEPVVMSGAVQIWSELRQRTLLYNIKVVKLQHNKISLQLRGLL